MKKNLLIAAALFAAVSANAQEYCAFNAEENSDFAALNLNGDAGTALTAGTVLGKTDHVVCTVGADDSFKSSSIGTITAGDAAINGGVQGSSNPKDADAGSPSSSLKEPVSGAFLTFSVTHDGYLYVFHKASSAKSYTVFEDGSALGYTFAALGDASTALGAVYGYVLQGEGEYNYLAAGTTVPFAEQIFLNWDGSAEWTKINAGGLGVIKFPVYNGLTYKVNANGSKITASGFYFDTTGDATVSASDKEGNAYNLLTSGEYVAAGIKDVKADKIADGVIYNLAGQKVNGSYKGVVIMNGRKFIQK